MSFGRPVRLSGKARDELDYYCSIHTSQSLRRFQLNEPQARHAMPADRNTREDCCSND